MYRHALGERPKQRSYGVITVVPEADAPLDVVTVTVTVYCAVPWVYWCVI